MIVGTPRYMSPEQLSGDPIDQRSDQFALGIVLYEMVAGQPPFQAKSLPSLVAAIISESPPSPSKIRRGVPPALARVISRCLEKNANDRYDSMSDLHDELRQIRDETTRPAMRISWHVVAVPIVLLLLAAGAAVFWWARGADRRWALDEAPGEIEARIESGDLYGAYQLVRRAQNEIPESPRLQTLLERFTMPLPLLFNPPSHRYVGNAGLERAYDS